MYWVLWVQHGRLGNRVWEWGGVGCMSILYICMERICVLTILQGCIACTPNSLIATDHHLPSAI